jgi:RNA polymerase sigma-70 factor (ECF subfamily)
MKTDIDIIEEILKGKKDYFSVLMEKYHNEIFKYVYNILGSYETTEDILQEIFLKTFKNLKKYNSNKASFRTWLYRVSTNHTLNFLKSKDYKNNYTNSIYEEATIKSDSSIEEDIVKEEKINQIKKLIDKLLKPKHQEIMFLHYFSGLTVKEIGETTDIPEKTIYKAIKTSIEKIKKEVATYEQA